MKHHPKALNTREHHSARSKDHETPLQREPQYWCSLSLRTHRSFEPEFDTLKHHPKRPPHLKNTIEIARKRNQKLFGTLCLPSLRAHRSLEPEFDLDACPAGAKEFCGKPIEYITDEKSCRTPQPTPFGQAGDTFSLKAGDTAVSYMHDAYTALRYFGRYVYRGHETFWGAEGCTFSPAFNGNGLGTCSRRTRHRCSSRCRAKPGRATARKRATFL